MSQWSMSDVKFDETALDLMLNQPGGAVGRHLTGLGRRIMVGARAIVGKRSGRLARSISLNLSRAARGQMMTIGSDLHYAYWNHEGTKPHIIDPVGNRIMTFNVGGRRIYTREIHHPGTRGTHFLTIPLRQVIR